MKRQKWAQNNQKWSRRRSFLPKSGLSGGVFARFCVQNGDFCPSKNDDFRGENQNSRGEKSNSRGESSNSRGESSKPRGENPVSAPDFPLKAPRRLLGVRLAKSAKKGKWLHVRVAYVCIKFACAWRVARLSHPIRRAAPRCGELLEYRQEPCGRCWQMD